MQSIGCRFLNSLLFLCASYCMIGCRTVKPSELPGKYLVRTAWGESTLVLSPDHRMEQEVRTKAGDIRRISGTWRFRDGSLVRVPCLEVTHNAPALYAGGCSHGVEVTLTGTVDISVESDYGLAYEKISSYSRQ
jgi:hypothetical protein